MLHAVHIDRYRGIARCMAEGLGRVNLVVGKNGSGKTSFLEAAVRAFASRDDDGLRVIRLERGERETSATVQRRA